MSTYQVTFVSVVEASSPEEAEEVARDNISYPSYEATAITRLD